MLRTEDDGRHPSLLAWTLKSVAAIAFLSFLAINWLAGPGLDGGALARLASVAGPGMADPVTTGSILNSAPSIKLDPCVVPRRP